MTDDELMALLADKPALRHAVARDELESWSARVQYWREHGAEGYRDDDLGRRSAIRTADVRRELVEFLEQVEVVPTELDRAEIEKLRRALGPRTPDDAA